MGKRLKIVFLLAAVLMSLILLSLVFGFLAFYVPSGTTKKVDSTNNISFSNEIAVDTPSGSGGGSSLPLFSIRGVTQTSYLRNLVGETYQNGNWQPLAGASSVPYNSSQMIAFNHTDYYSVSDVDFQILPSTAFGGFIPSAKETYWISLGWSLQYFTDQQVFFSANTFTDSYNLNYASYKFDVTTLKQAETVQDNRYLGVPSDLIQKLRPLALNITQNFTSPFDQATAIENFLKHNYSYDLDYTPAPSGIDPVIWFLFNSTRGVCTHFNSAFVLLARSIGIPARLCGGFLIEPLSNYQTVTSAQRHAYGEVLFKNLGWITFDATGLGNSSDVKPHINIVYPTQNSTVSGRNISVVGQAVGFGKDANVSIDYPRFVLTSWNSTDGDFTFSNSSFIVDGGYSVMVSAVDGSGNKASRTVMFIVDNTFPKVNIEYPVNGTVVASSPIIVYGTVVAVWKNDVMPLINDSRFVLVNWDSSSGTFTFENVTNVTGNVSLLVSLQSPGKIVGSSSVVFEIVSTAQTPTLTTITYCSNVGIKGSNFTVEGRVVDVNGNGLNDLDVFIYLTRNKNEMGTICGRGKTVNGGYFNITCYVDIDVQVGEYQVVAHSLGNTKYADSWSDPKITIMAETAVSLTFPSEVIVGRTFTVEGTLKEKLSSQPLTNETLFFVEAGGWLVYPFFSDSLSLVTDSAGNFSLDLICGNPGNITMSVYFDGSGTYLNSSASGNLSILGITILPTTNTTLIRSESVSLTGRLFAGDLPVDNEPLNVLLGGKEIVGWEPTDSLGYFNFTFPVWNSSPFGNQSLGQVVIEYDAQRLPGLYAMQNVTIAARTSLTCNATHILKQGDTLNITASLKDDQGLVMGNESIKLNCAFNERDSSILTRVTGVDGNAAYAGIVIPPSASSNLTYTVSFPGNATYLPATYFGSVEFLSTSSPYNMLFIILGISLPTSLTIISAAIWKKKKAPKNVRSSSVEQSAPIVSEVPPVVIAAVPSRKKAQLLVRFPQISDLFPLVWGVNEALTIELELKGCDEPVSPEDFSLRIDDAREGSLKGSGSTFLSSCVFDVKGGHRLKAKFSGKDDWEEVTSEAEVKIVDYREEIVDLFNSFFKSAKAKFRSVHDEMTPRELQSTLVGQMGASKQEPLETAVSVFEVADYSLHQVARRDYERIYLALKKLEG